MEAEQESLSNYPDTFSSEFNSEGNSIVTVAESPNNEKRGRGGLEANVQDIPEAIVVVHQWEEDSGQHHPADNAGDAVADATAADNAAEAVAAAAGADNARDAVVDADADNAGYAVVDAAAADKAEKAVADAAAAATPPLLAASRQGLLAVRYLQQREVHVKKFCVVDPK